MKLALASSLAFALGTAHAMPAEDGCYSSRTYRGAFDQVRSMQARIHSNVDGSSRLDLRVVLRNGRGTHVVSLDCNPEESGVRCSWNGCDGGSVTLGGYYDQLTITNNGISLSNCADRELDENGEVINPVERVWLANTTHDRRFHLSSTPNNCNF